MPERPQRLVFGEVAADYDEVRAGYPAELADVVVDYAGHPSDLVEVGAGTGLATAVFAGAGRRITCLEPDPAMAAVLRARFAGRPGVRVLPCGFEDWTPPAGGVGLLYAAQSWHWVDPAVGWTKAHDALAPGAALALFGHTYAFVDTGLESAITDVYTRIAPELADQPWDDVRTATDHPLYRDLVAGGLFTDASARWMETVVAYPRARYRRLLQTFSPHRMLPPDRRAALHDGIDAVVDRHGGTVEVALRTLLVLGRRPVR
jgi:SAM-dependent methyltransferase